MEVVYKKSRTYCSGVTHDQIYSEANLQVSSQNFSEFPITGVQNASSSLFKSGENGRNIRGRDSTSQKLLCETTRFKGTSGTRLDPMQLN
jgi:hypothetical protein